MSFKLNQGYYRYPAVFENNIVFVSEDDLWYVEKKGGTARRLTSNLGESAYPYFSPCGKYITFAGTEEGHSEIYIMPSEGGLLKRLTFLGSYSYVVGWKEDKIIFASNHGQAFARNFELFEIGYNGGLPKKLSYGPARSISFGKKGTVIGRNTNDPARWKRYKGGTAGELWVDADNSGEFTKLIVLKGNTASPMWIDERIYFISDHEGIGNIYSVKPNGEDLTKHTFHTDYYARFANTDGKSIVYHCGADIYMYSLSSGKTEKIDIRYHTPYTQRNRKFTAAETYLEDFNISSNASKTAVTARGKMFCFGNWEGPVKQFGKQNGVRYRYTNWLNDNSRIVSFNDEEDEYGIEVYSFETNDLLKRIKNENIGIPYGLKVSPKADKILFQNHKHELIMVDLDSEDLEVIDRNEFSPMLGYSWSPDGRYITYGISVNSRQSIIRIFDIEKQEKHNITEAVYNDYDPVFSGCGKYLFFNSSRVFNPVYDNMMFDLGFPKGSMIYAVVLDNETDSPFVEKPRPYKEEMPEEKENGEKTGDGNKKDDELKIRIDFEGIKERISAFPISEDKYGKIESIGTKVFYTTYPIEGALGKSWGGNEPEAKAVLKYYDLKNQEEEVFHSGITAFKKSADSSAIILRIGNELRVVNPEKGKEPLPKESKPGRKTGWIDLKRVKISINPIEEWKQMFKEAWRLQREYFWAEDMSDIDWNKVFERYYPLIERVGSRKEFSDLMWEMQGELGTSHAYEFGGDYKDSPRYTNGHLGADFLYNEKFDAYEICSIAKGDLWASKNPSPLLRAGLNIKEGMLLKAVKGVKLDKETTPYELLVNTASQEIELTVADENNENERNIVVITASQEFSMRYRDWVEKNRDYVHKKTNGKVGYIHVPDMGANGYAEFHRYFLVELDYDGLIIDVRYNGGGHVSQILLSKLARKRIGFDKTRWMGYEPYPSEAPNNALVALTNEHAGSDGDIFSHSFKLMNLGKLVGKRTWGGVIGIWPRNWLVDGTITTQPEFSFWFKDVGWKVENYGTDPDIVVENKPEDYGQNIDRQLDTAIETVLEELEKNPPLKPDFNNRPKLTLPKE